MAADNHPVDLARRLSHVRWLAGGTGSGKSTLELRMARDELWDAEVRRQAADLGLPVLAVDGSRDLADLVADLATRFRLRPRLRANSGSA